MQQITKEMLGVCNMKWIVLTKNTINSIYRLVNPVSGTRIYKHYRHYYETVFANTPERFSHAVAPTTCAKLSVKMQIFAYSQGTRMRKSGRLSQPHAKRKNRQKNKIPKIKNTKKNLAPPPARARRCCRFRSRRRCRCHQPPKTTTVTARDRRDRHRPRPLLSPPPETATAAAARDHRCHRRPQILRRAPSLSRPEIHK